MFNILGHNQRTFERFYRCVRMCARCVRSKSEILDHLEKKWEGKRGTGALLFSPSTTATGKLLTSNVSCGAALQQCNCVGQLPGVNL